MAVIVGLKSIAEHSISGQEAPSVHIRSPASDSLTDESLPAF
jgi:hypothetical protein